MAGFFYNVLTSGIKTKLEPEQRVKLVSLNAMMLLGATMMAFFGIRDLSHGGIILGSVVCGISILIFGVFFLVRLTRNFMLGGYVITIIAFLLFTYLTFTGSSDGSGTLWMNVFPVISYFLLGEVIGSWFVGFFLVSQALIFFLPGYGNLVLGLDMKARLIGTYLIIALYSLAFEIIRRRAQSEVENSRASLVATTDQLLEQKARTDGILTNVQEGIFLLNETLSIEPQYSRRLETILGKTDLTGLAFLEVFRGRIPDRLFTAASDYLEMFFQPNPNLPLLMEINPLDRVELTDAGRGDFPSKHLVFSFTLITLEKGSSRLLVTVRDVTEEVVLSQRLKEEEGRADRQMKSLFQIIHVKPDLMKQFLEDAQHEIDEVNRLLKVTDSDPQELLVHLFHAVHAIKGNAALLGLKGFSTQAHGIEEKIVKLREKPYEWNHLLTITVDLSILQNELDEIRGLLERVSSFQNDLGESSSGKEDLLVLTLKKAIEKASQDTGKLAELDSSSFDGDLIPSAIRKNIKDILIQMVRNSVVHGIETPQDRELKGKPRKGLITIQLEMQMNMLVLNFKDDGQGLNEDLIRAKATTLASWKNQDLTQWNSSKILGIIFSPGFSTSENPGIHSGRGVGMSLIKSKLEAIGGTLKIKNSLGKGLLFEISIPFTQKW